MPALLVVTIAQEPARSLFAWRFLIAFGGGPDLLRSGSSPRACSAAVAWPGVDARLGRLNDKHRLRCVADPAGDLWATSGVAGGHRNGFVAVMMFPFAVILQELDPAPNAICASSRQRSRAMLFSIRWSYPRRSASLGRRLALRSPAGQRVFPHYCRRADRLRSLRDRARALDRRIAGQFRTRSAPLAIVKLLIMPLIVFGLSIEVRLDPLYTAAAVICAAVPTAKTVYILADEYHCENRLWRRRSR